MSHAQLLSSVSLIFVFCPCNIYLWNRTCTCEERLCKAMEELVSYWILWARLKCAHNIMHMHAPTVFTKLGWMPRIELMSGKSLFSFSRFLSLTQDTHTHEGKALVLHTHVFVYLSFLSLNTTWIHVCNNYRQTMRTTVTICPWFQRLLYINLGPLSFYNVWHVINA